MERKQILREALDNLQGARPAVLDAGGCVLRTRGAVGERAQRWAERLEAAGAAGQVVVFAMPNGPEWPEVFLGLLLAGGVPLPCELPAKEEVLAAWQQAQGSRPWVLTTGPQGAELAAADPCPAPEGVFVLKSTSGTTARRRAIAFSAEAFRADARQVRAGMGIRESDINLAAIPFSHSYGLTSLVAMLLWEGVAMVIATEPLPRPLCAALQHASVFPGVPTHFRALAALPPPERRPRLCISAAAPLAAADAAAFWRGWGRKIHSFYGAGECGGICFDASEDPDVPEGFVGLPLPGVRLQVREVDEGLRVRVSGPAVGATYVPAAEGDALHGGEFEPADILRREAGGFVIVGRSADFANVGGRKVSCLEIERALRALPGVEDAAVFVAPGPGGTEVLAACVASRRPLAELRLEVSRHLPPWHVPKHWFPVEALPVDARGKLSRAALRRRYFPQGGLPAAGSLPE